MSDGEYTVIAVCDTLIPIRAQLVPAKKSLLRSLDITAVRLCAAAYCFLQLPCYILQAEWTSGNVDYVDTRLYEKDDAKKPGCSQCQENGAS